MADKTRKLGNLIQQKVASNSTSTLQVSSTQLQDLIEQAEAAKELQATQSDQSAIEQLQQTLETLGGKFKVEIHSIDPDPNQPRKTFPKSVIEERAESMTRNGQLSPIILIPQENGRFVLFEGELRYRAATYLKWQSLDAVFLPSDGYQPIDADRFQKQMLTSAHAQRLHDLDLAEGILRLVELRYPVWAGRTGELPRILNTAITRLKRSGQIENLRAIRNAPADEQRAWIKETLKEHEQPVFEVILGMQHNPDTVLRHNFPLLSLSNDLKELVRTTGLDSSKVKELQKLNSKTLNVDEKQALKVRSQMAKAVVEQQLPLSEIKKEVAKVIEQHSTEPIAPKVSPTVKRVQAIEVVGVDLEELKSLREALRHKLKEVEAQIKSV